MRILKIIFLWILIPGIPMHAQSMKESRDYVIKTPFIESDGRVVSQVFNDRIYLLGKAKGGNAQYSQYFLQCYDDRLSQQWSVKLEFDEEDQILGIHTLDDHLALFWVTHNEKEKSRSVSVQTFQLSNGDPGNTSEIVSQKIKKWRDTPNKGRSVSGLKNVINSGNRKDLVTPLEYRFRLSISPDHSRIMFYGYDYSKEDLYIDLFVFDSELKAVNKARIPVNRGFINQENLVNNRGEVYMINRKDNGLIAVVNYDIKNKKSDYLEIDASNTLRESLRSLLAQDDRLYVASVNTRDGLLAGVSYAEFDFSNDRVGKIVYQELDETFRMKTDSLRKISGNSPANSWMNYAIADFTLLPDKGKSIIIEQRDYQSRGFLYDPEAGDHPDMWAGERLGELIAGDVFIFSFDPGDKLRWQRTLLKEQKGNAQEGLNVIGFRSDYSSQGNLRLIYERNRSMSQTLYYLEYKLHNGLLIRDEILENPDKMNILLPYTSWLADGFVLVGRKGFSGKISKLLLYTY